MKPLFVLPSLAGGGAERVTLNLVRRLNRAHFDPRLFLIENWGEYRNEIPSDATLCCGVDTECPLHLSEVLREAFPKLVKWARESDVVVGCIQGRSSNFGYAAARLARRPFVAWVRSTLGERLRTTSELTRVAWRLVYGGAERVVAISHGVRASLAKVVDLPPDRATVIYNPIEVEGVQRLADDPLPAWALPIYAHPVVVSVGRLGPEKNQSMLIRAHALLLRAGLPHQLVILGKGRMLSELRTLALELGVANTIHFPGFVPNPFPFIKHAAAFALTSNYEGFGNVLVEALATGCPVVATDCPGGPREILGEGKFGKLVTVDDAKSLAASLTELLTSPTHRNQLRSIGPARAFDFAWDRMMPAWEHLLSTSCGKERAVVSL